MPPLSKRYKSLVLHQPGKSVLPSPIRTEDSLSARERRFELARRGRTMDFLPNVLQVVLLVAQVGNQLFSAVGSHPRVASDASARQPRNPLSPDDFGHRRAGFCLLQREGNLLVRVPGIHPLQLLARRLHKAGKLSLKLD
jgi:hypothetical protein